MIKNPTKEGCDFEFVTFKRYATSYTDVPVDLLDAFISYFLHGFGIVSFNESGPGYSLILRPYDSYILIEHDTNPALHTCHATWLRGAAMELIKDIESDIDAWASFYVKDKPAYIEYHKKEIQIRLNYLKKISGYNDNMLLKKRIQKQVIQECLLTDLVKKKLITMEAAANELDITTEEFEKVMAQYSEPK